MTHHDWIRRPSSRKSEAGFSFVRKTQAERRDDEDSRDDGDGHEERSGQDLHRPSPLRRRFAQVRTRSTSSRAKTNVSQPPRGTPATTATR